MSAMGGGPDAFRLTASPETAIWRKPLDVNLFNAPTHDLASGALTRFRSARITFSPSGATPWSTTYDQAGLLLHMTQDGQKDRWIKAGIEHFAGTPHLASVGCDTWSDWALSPPADPEANNTTIELRREGIGRESTLWLYHIVDGKEIPVRQITWVFADEGGWNMRVAAMVGRPASAEGVLGQEKGLTIEFKDGDVVFV